MVDLWQDSEYASELLLHQKQVAKGALVTKVEIRKTA